MGKFGSTKSPRKTRVDLAIELEEAFDVTNDRRYLDASKILMSELKVGRRPANDTDALYRMVKLLKTGAVKSRWAAACRVAEEIGGHSLKSTATRLDRKYAKHGDYYQRTLHKLAVRGVFQEYERRMQRAMELAAPTLEKLEKQKQLATEAMARVLEYVSKKGSLTRDAAALVFGRSNIFPGHLDRLLAVQEPGLSPEELRELGR